ncbi:MAG: serine/threonine protein kinase [Deltaproteobacteria bacterium]|nr:serine/threonine protein kinase [Deltaproteobacteria bacterium]
MALTDVLTGTIEVLPSWVGQVLSGKYAVLGGLGMGAVGTVFEAEDLSVGRRVALKILNPQLAGNRELLARFEREARVAVRIAHPNIVEVLDVGRTDDGLPFIVMELLEGQDLYHVLNDGGPMSPVRAIDIAIQTLDALGAAHAAGVVHRDLKPENVFLTQRGQRKDFVKLLDFGIAKCRDAFAESTRLTAEGCTLGTPAYMSPEQARGERGLDARSDLYSVGVLLYEMLSGRLPHGSANHHQILVAIISRDAPPLRAAAPRVPADLAEVVDRAMARSPGERFQTAAELTAALRTSTPTGTGAVTSRRSGALGGSAPRAAASSPSSPLPPPLPRIGFSPRRSRRLWIGASGCVLAVAVGSVGLLVGARPDLDEPLPPRPDRASLPVPAPAAPPVEAAASIAVLSSPPGAQVLLDGRAIGVTPLHVSLVADRRSHLLRVEAEGRGAVERPITLWGPLRIAVELPPIAPVPAVSAGQPPHHARPVEAGRLLFEDL